MASPAFSPLLLLLLLCALPLCLPAASLEHVADARLSAPLEHKGLPASAAFRARKLGPVFKSTPAASVPRGATLLPLLQSSLEPLLRNTHQAVLSVLPREVLRLSLPKSLSLGVKLTALPVPGSNAEAPKHRQSAFDEGEDEIAVEVAPGALHIARPAAAGRELGEQELEPEEEVAVEVREGAVEMEADAEDEPAVEFKPRAVKVQAWSSPDEVEDDDVPVRVRPGALKWNSKTANKASFKNVANLRTVTPASDSRSFKMSL